MGLARAASRGQRVPAIAPGLVWTPRLRLLLPLLVMVASLTVLHLSATPAAADIITVTITADEDSDTGVGAGCSLREAIVAANTDAYHGGCARVANPGTDIIRFDLGPIVSLTPHRIVILGALGNLPTIDSSVIVDGWSQGTTYAGAPATYSGPPLVWLEPNTSSITNFGITIAGDAAGDQVTVQGLAFTRFYDAIHIQGEGSHTIWGNYFGGLPILQASGNTFVTPGTSAQLVGGVCTCLSPLSNFRGVFVLGQVLEVTPTFPTVAIGGTDTTQANVIVQNAEGGVSLTETSGATILGNFFGTDRTGASGLGNGAGIFVQDSENVTIGNGTTAGRNTIVGSTSGGGIRFDGGTSHTVKGNSIGLNQLGAAVANATAGIVILETTAVDIGGPAAGEGNVISGNTGPGIYLEGVVGTGLGVTRIRGNIIGLNPAGTAAIGNSTSGIHGFDASDYDIGGSAPGEGNVISGNGGSGVTLEGFATDDVDIHGNRIGTTAAGTAGVPPVGNILDGITLIPEDSDEDAYGPSYIDIGEDGLGNVISGNGGAGIFTLNAYDVEAEGNIIGLAADGDTVVANYIGIVAISSYGVDIGGNDSSERNVISGNITDGIVFQDMYPLACSCDFDLSLIIGNYIGLNAAGNADRGNGGSGVRFVNVSGMLIGSPYPGEGNVISGNQLDGITVVGTVVFETLFNGIFANRIGTDAAGLVGIANERNGISLIPETEFDAGPVGTVIGSGEPGAGNLISGNKQHGIYLANVIAFPIPPLDPVLPPPSTETVIGQNLIGVNANGGGSLPNQRSGVFIEFSFGVVVYENMIANSGRAGVIITPEAVDDSCFCTDVAGNLLTANRIYDNAGLGIELTDDNSADGPANTVSPNDLTETDEIQNFPVLTSASSSASGTVVGGTLTSVPETSVKVEGFSSPSCDPSGHGEGRTYLGSFDVATGAAQAPHGTGVATFNRTVSQVPLGHFITATAYNELYMTSEFSACVPVTTAQIVVSPTSGLTTSETGGTATFTINLSTTPTQSVTINLSNSKPGEASISPTSVVFPANVAPTPKTVTLTGLQDNVVDGNQAYTIVTSAAVSSDPAYSNLDVQDVQAINQDSPTVPTLSVESAQATEGGVGTSVPMVFTVQLTPKSAQPVTVNWQVVEGTAKLSTDIHASDSAGTLTFSPGEDAKQITIRILGDTAPEQSETFTVRLVTATNAAIGAQIATGTILDNDVAAGPCSPRKNVVITTQRSGTNQLVVTVKAGQGTIKKISFGTAGEPMVNAQIETIGPASVIQGYGVLTPPPGVTQQTFVVRRIVPNQPVMVEYIVEDDCGGWTTFVGTGANPW